MTASRNPITPRPLHELADAGCRVMSVQELREHGVSSAAAHERCRPGGPWQMPLPGVFLLHAGPPTAEETLHAVLRYTGGRPGEAMVSGLAGLALHGFAAVPPLAALNRVDVLVPRTRRLRSSGCARIVRTHRLPRPVEVAGFPVAPAPRALVDAVVRLVDPLAVRRLMVEAVRGGHCDPQAVVREFGRARLRGRPQVAGAVEALLAETRGMAEERLMELVRVGGLPDPCWNVELWLPDGPCLGAVDAYWPDHGVAVAIDDRAPRQAPAARDPRGSDPGGTEAGGTDAWGPDVRESDVRESEVSRPAAWGSEPWGSEPWGSEPWGSEPRESHARGARASAAGTSAGEAAGGGDAEPDPAAAERARRRAALERLGVSVLHLTPRRLREPAEPQISLLRAALLRAAARDTAAGLVVLPR